MGDDNNYEPDETYTVVIDTGCPGADAALGTILEDYGGTPCEVDISENGEEK